MAEGAVLVYSRKRDGEHIKVLVNLGDNDYPYAIDGDAVELLTNEAYGGFIKSGRAMIVLCCDTEE